MYMYWLRRRKEILPLEEDSTKGRRLQRRNKYPPLTEEGSTAERQRHLGQGKKFGGGIIGIDLLQSVVFSLFFWDPRASANVDDASREGDGRYRENHHSRSFPTLFLFSQPRKLFLGTPLP